MTAFYNEIDPYAAQWLRNLITAGHIAFGVVDERSIEDIEPAELDGYTQCHFFAGIGVWSLALRNAGWPDDKPIWTGSCPCQPFSSAGKGTGFDDERHLWPAFHHLIEQCRPATVIGEQVASKDAEPWLDLVQADLEALDYAFGAVPFPSASVGAPHIRDRLYWVGHSNHTRLERLRSGHQAQKEWDIAGRSIGTASGDGGVANTMRGNGNQRFELESNGRSGDPEQDGLGGEFGKLADTSNGRAARGNHDAQHDGQQSDAARNLDIPSPINGFWEVADWLFCRDGKWRPVESGTFPLAHGAASRVGRLRAYGNAINAKAAQVFVECYMESQSC